MVVADTGVEGVMRSCCEKTLGVLRENKESLITIIEVAALLHANQKGLWPCCFMLVSAVSSQGKHQTRVSIVA